MAGCKVAAQLDAQGEIVLAGDVRYFAMHLPPVLTDRERLAAEFLRFAKHGEIRADARRRPATRSRDGKNAVRFQRVPSSQRDP